VREEADAQGKDDLGGIDSGSGDDQRREERLDQHVEKCEEEVTSVWEKRQTQKQEREETMNAGRSSGCQLPRSPQLKPKTSSPRAREVGIAPLFGKERPEWEVEMKVEGAGEVGRGKSERRGLGRVCGALEGRWEVGLLCRMVGRGGGGVGAEERRF
jgi:hypothetical protein